MLTYGDGVSDLDLDALLAFHRTHGKLATITAVRPPARFGELEFDDNLVTRFSEKPQLGEGWINGGFFVLEPEVLDLIPGDVHWESNLPASHTTRGSGMDTMNLPPPSRYSACWATISSAKFQVKSST